MIAEFARNAILITTLLLTSKVDNSPVVVNQSAPPDRQITLLFAGDIMQHGPQITAAYNDSTKTYDYTSCFAWVKPVISSADIAIANLEVTLAGAPYTGYPQFSAPDALALGARDAGFDVLATANNHSCDRGDAGVLRTIRVLDSLGIKRTGTFSDSADYQKQHPLILQKNDISIALLNYTYGTNGLPFHYPAMVNLINEEQLAADIQRSKQMQADFIVVFFHWGDEYQSQPNTQQIQLAELALKEGADAVIGSHPHVLQPMEFRSEDSIKSTQLIVYSLGNFVSNQRTRYRDGGAMVSFTLNKTWKEKTISDPAYHLTWVHTPVINGKKQYCIVPVNSNYVINDTSDLYKFNTFVDDSRTLLNTSAKAIPEASYSY